MAHDHRSDITYAALLVVVLATAWYIRDVLLLIYVAALFAVVLGPAVSFVRSARIGSWHPSRALAVLTIILAAVIFISALLVFLAPPIIHDLQAFSSDVPKRSQDFIERLHQLPLGSRINANDLQHYAETAVGGLFGLFAGIAGGLFGFFSGMVLTAYFIVDGERAVEWILSFFPIYHRGRLRQTLERAEHKISKWLFGQALLMLLLGTTSSIVFRLIGLRYPLALGVFAGLANIVPIIGPLTAAALALVVAAIDSWNKAIGVSVFFAIYQQIESAYLTPKIMRSTVDLPALSVLIGLAVGGKLAGIVGAFVAVPTAALIGVIADEYLVQRAGKAAGE